MIHLFFFAALVATANGFTCICSGMPDCGKDGTCTSSGKCFSFKGKTEIGNDVIEGTLKGCQNAASSFDMCSEKDVFLTAGNGFSLTSNIACCETDKCNQDLTPELKKSTNYSSLVCPSCFALDAKSCDPKDEYCTVSQTKCLNVTGSFTKGTSPAKEFVGKGCATPTASFIKSGLVFFFGNASYSIAEVNLEDAKDSASQLSSCLIAVVLLLSTTGLLLDNILY